ncbi:MAG: hypothetical protein KBC62_03885 [Candidatus Pacebacteria bacterium]|nr:hypothetical protein [Candidatus Paceibacterota bacterium]
MISEKYLIKNYLQKRFSAKEIAAQAGCSVNKINYWLNKYAIPKRTISEAVYIKANPAGDPFLLRRPQSSEDWFLYGLGLGLFWGEGNKVNKHSVRLGNVDPALIRYFLLFLTTFYQVDKTKLRFGLQIFSDTSPETALNFWTKSLNVKASSFHKKIIVSKSKKRGTYKRKSRYGVLTVYFSNSKLRDNIIDAIGKLQNDQMPS